MPSTLTLQTATLRDALDHAAKRTIERELTEDETDAMRAVYPRKRGFSGREGVLFTDGTALLVVEEYGFGGGDMTPPEPSEVAIYIARPI